MAKRLHLVCTVCVCRFYMKIAKINIEDTDETGFTGWDAQADSFSLSFKLATLGTKDDSSPLASTKPNSRSSSNYIGSWRNTSRPCSKRREKIGRSYKGFFSNIGRMSQKAFLKLYQHAGKVLGWPKTQWAAYQLQVQLVTQQLPAMNWLDYIKLKVRFCNILPAPPQNNICNTLACWHSGSLNSPNNFKRSAAGCLLVEEHNSDGIFNLNVLEHFITWLSGGSKVDPLLHALLLTETI